jgi:hypothetical protein
MNITGREWDRMVVLFKEVLARHQVPSGESQELLAIIDSSKAGYRCGAVKSYLEIRSHPG